MTDEIIYGNSASTKPSPSSIRVWYALDVAYERIAGEAVDYSLMEAGALGTQSEDRGGELKSTIAYFDSAPDITHVRAILADALRIYDLPSSAVHDIALQEVADRDWLGEWKKGWQPVTIGRFIVAPPWSDVKGIADRIIIRIEPGMAFGTGTHETTRLCLAAIEKFSEGESFLDVGTGTGILAIAAAKLSPTVRVAACDIDIDAVRIARENAFLNEVSDRIEFETGTVGETTASANLVCANLTADVIVTLLPQLIAATCGRLVLSGILVEQLKMITGRLAELAINDHEIETDGEWAAVIV